MFNILGLPTWLSVHYRAYFPAPSTNNDRQSSSAPETDEFAGPYRLDNNTSATVTLPDGRKMGYAEFGVKDGHPVLFCHGLPGARKEGAFLDAAARKVGVRLITMERPGFGWSTPHPGRTILDHPKDVQCLTEQLGLKSYSVIGVSGGGPYALACAYTLPKEQLKAVSIVCGVAPPEAGYRGMNFFHYMGFKYAYRLTPSLCRLWFANMPVARLDLTDEERLRLTKEDWAKNKSKAPPQDAVFLEDDNKLRLFLRNGRESYGQGLWAVEQDGHLMAKDFGFRVEDIRPDLPFSLWYGKLDDNVPPSHGEYLAAKLGPRAHLRLEEDTHAGIFMNHEEEILQAIVDAM